MATEYREQAGPDNEEVGPVDLAAVDASGATADGEPVRRKRGRPRGSRNTAGTASKAKATPLDLTSLTGMFVGLHALLAERTNTPELMLDEAEGKEFMLRAQNVMRHYSVETTQKTLDWIAFMGTATGIYATRFAAIAMNRKLRRAQNEPGPASFLDLSGGFHAEPEPPLN